MDLVPNLLPVLCLTLVSSSADTTNPPRRYPQLVGGWTIGEILLLVLLVSVCELFRCHNNLLFPGSPWGGMLPAATMLGPQQASGFGVPRTPTPHTVYEPMPTPPGFIYSLPPGRTPSNLAHSYPLPASSSQGAACPPLRLPHQGLEAGHIEAIEAWEVHLCRTLRLCCRSALLVGL